MIITTKDTMGKERTYEVVSKIPAGFFVWSIGDNMGSDEYIPLCQLLHAGTYNINANTVKAIKLDKSDVMILREAAHYGVVSKKTAISALKRPAKSLWQKTKKQLAEKALPIFEQITA